MTPELAAVYRRRLSPDDAEALEIWSDLARVCHVSESTHVAGDPHASAFREGKRAVFLYLAGLVSLPLRPGG